MEHEQEITYLHHCHWHLLGNHLRYLVCGWRVVACTWEDVMTCIAYKDGILAADKQSTSAGYGSTVTKIHRVPGGIVGFTGNEGHAVALLEWFRNGRDPEKWPKKGGTDAASVVFVTHEGLFTYTGEDGPNACKREDAFDAWGAGYAYALAVMHMGFCAQTAVEVACALDVNCGKGIDVLELEPKA